MSITHCIITRLNLKFSNTPVDEKVMEYRIRLFENGLLQSLKAQINKNFIHYQVADKELPVRLKRWQESLGEVLFLDSKGCKNNILTMDQPGGFLCNELAKRVSSDFLITTNIDSDDLLNVNFAKEIYDSILDNVGLDKIPTLLVSKEKYNFSIEKGLSSLISSESGLHRKKMKCPQTFSILERKIDMLSCYADIHGNMGDYCKEKKYLKSPFLEIFHNANVCQTYNEDLIKKQNINWTVDEKTLTIFFQQNYGVEYSAMLEAINLDSDDMTHTVSDIRSHFLSNWKSVKKSIKNSNSTSLRSFLIGKTK